MPTPIEDNEEVVQAHKSLLPGSIDGNSGSLRRVTAFQLKSIVAAPANYISCRHHSQNHALYGDVTFLELWYFDFVKEITQSLAKSLRYLDRCMRFSL